MKFKVCKTDAKYPYIRGTIVLPHKPMIRIDPPIWVNHPCPLSASGHNADHINELGRPN